MHRLIALIALLPTVAVADHCNIRRFHAHHVQKVVVPAITYVPYVYPAVGYGAPVQQASHLTQDEILDGVADRVVQRLESRLRLPQAASATKFNKCYACHGPQSNKADAREAFSLQNDPPTPEEAALMQYGVLEGGMSERAGFEPTDVLEFLKETNGIIRAARPDNSLPLSNEVQP